MLIYGIALSISSCLGDVVGNPQQVPGEPPLQQFATRNAAGTLGHLPETVQRFKRQWLGKINLVQTSLP